MTRAILGPFDHAQPVGHVDDTGSVPYPIGRHELVAVGVADVLGAIADDGCRNQCGPKNAVVTIEKDSGKDIETVEIANRGQLTRFVAAMDAPPLDLIARTVITRCIERLGRIAFLRPPEGRAEQVSSKIDRRSGYLPSVAPRVRNSSMTAA